MYGPLHFLSLERDKTKALKANNSKFDKYLSSSNSTKSELQWWPGNVVTTFNVIKREHPTHKLSTHTCNDCWGMVYVGKKTRGAWSNSEKEHHINYLKLLALFLGLKLFFADTLDSHVRLMIDNSTSVSVINHMGTSHSSKLNALCQSIWGWALEQRLWLSAAHIPSKRSHITTMQTGNGCWAAKSFFLYCPVLI